MRSRTGINEGARFVKAESFDHGVWVVKELLDRPGFPRHVRLVKEGVRGESLTVAAAMLRDRSRFLALAGKRV